MRRSDWVAERFDNTDECREKPKLCPMCKAGIYSGIRLLFKGRLILTLLDTGEVYGISENLKVDALSISVKEGKQ